MPAISRKPTYVDALIRALIERDEVLDRDERLIVGLFLGLWTSRNTRSRSAPTTISLGAPDNLCGAQYRLWPRDRDVLNSVANHLDLITAELRDGSPLHSWFEHYGLFQSLQKLIVSNDFAGLWVDLTYAQSWIEEPSQFDAFQAFNVMFRDHIFSAAAEGAADPIAYISKIFDVFSNGDIWELFFAKWHDLRALRDVATEALENQEELIFDPECTQRRS